MSTNKQKEEKKSTNITEDYAHNLSITYNQLSHIKIISNCNKINQILERNLCTTLTPQNKKNSFDKPPSILADITHVLR